MTPCGRILVGTSGWAYDHWAPAFYPAGLDPAERLRFLAARLPSVEVNRSFYRLPSREVLEGWRDETPEPFLFAFKASRYLTHMKKLKDAAGPVDTLMAAADVLGDKLGPVLFQLPPRWRCDAGRLRAFLEVLPPGHRYAFELRDPSWYAPEVLAALAGKGAAFCVYELAGHASPREVTAGFVYVRLHGPGAAYEGRYSDAALAEWAGTIAAWAAGGLDVYCYFDNDQAGHAARDAVRLWSLVGGFPRREAAGVR